MTPTIVTYLRPTDTGGAVDCSGETPVTDGYAPSVGLIVRNLTAKGLEQADGRVTVRMQPEGLLDLRNPQRVTVYLQSSARDDFDRIVYLAVDPNGEYPNADINISWGSWPPPAVNLATGIRFIRPGFESCPINVQWCVPFGDAVDDDLPLTALPFFFSRDFSFKAMGFAPGRISASGTVNHGSGGSRYRYFAASSLGDRNAFALYASDPELYNQFYAWRHWGSPRQPLAVTRERRAFSLVTKTLFAAQVPYPSGGSPESIAAYIDGYTAFGRVHGTWQIDADQWPVIQLDDHDYQVLGFGCRSMFVTTDNWGGIPVFLRRL
jgi:hypothetical protein